MRRNGQRPTRREHVGFRALLCAIGTVATVEGARGVLQGVRQVVDAGPTSANVDSEFRFYSAWYHVCGLLLLDAARRPQAESRMVRAFAGGFLLAACGRVLSIRRLGPPHPAQRVLLALELVIPAIIVPWQTRLARDNSRDPTDLDHSVLAP